MHGSLLEFYASCSAPVVAVQSRTKENNPIERIRKRAPSLVKWSFPSEIQNYSLVNCPVRIAARWDISTSAIGTSAHWALPVGTSAHRDVSPLGRQSVGTSTCWDVSLSGHQLVGTSAHGNKTIANLGLD